MQLKLLPQKINNPALARPLALPALHIVGTPARMNHCSALMSQVNFRRAGSAVVQIKRCALGVPSLKLGNVSDKPNACVESCPDSYVFLHNYGNSL